MDKHITHEQLIELLDYNPLTGIFTWKKPTNSGMKAGKIAGKDTSSGYRSIRIKHKSYSAHRLAWFYVHGSMPAEFIDHINGVRYDNRIENLREANNSLNRQNLRKASKNNLSGFLGVRVRKNRFDAKIKVNGVMHYLGFFKTAELAHEAYLNAKRKLHVGCTI